MLLNITNGNDNIPVTSSTNAFDEETWKYFQIGNDAKFRFLKRCPRCTVPARNPANGDWLYPKNKRLPQKTLKKMFPLKTIDKEWEEQSSYDRIFESAWKARYDWERDILISIIKDNIKNNNEIIIITYIIKLYL